MPITLYTTYYQQERQTRIINWHQSLSTSYSQSNFTTTITTTTIVTSTAITFHWHITFYHPQFKRQTFLHPIHSSQHNLKKMVHSSSRLTQNLTSPQTLIGVYSLPNIFLMHVKVTKLPVGGHYGMNTPKIQNPTSSHMANAFYFVQISLTLILTAIFNGQKT